MKRIICLALALTLGILPVGCAPANEKEEIMSTPTADFTASSELTASVEVEGFGTIVLELYPDIAPETVRNFCSLARKGFYNGLTFHRIIEGFMIQGGDPEGSGSGGPGYCIKGEFDLNGFKNGLAHTRGVISMARLSRYMDSAGSQFFIMQKDAPHLDGGYAAFGKVISGIEVVDAIAAVETGVNDRPLEPVVIKSVTVTGPELPEPEKLPDIH